jgi:integrase
MEGSIHAMRADKNINIPVVMTREEVAAVLSLMNGTAQLVAELLYGSGLRIMEAVRTRVKDIDVQIKPLTVCSGKGDKDRCTTVPATLTPVLQNHLTGVKTWHQQDLAPGHGEVDRPRALTRKYPTPPRQGASRVSFLPGISPLTLVLASLGAITWTPASSTTPSRWRLAVPV